MRVLARSETSGIIPAYAGNTTIAPIGWAKVWDHPRVCGEHDTAEPTNGRNTGSSPRMRGTRTVPAIVPADRRIIPAYAGNTTVRAISAREGRDHPRVCGEHFIEQTDAPRIVGSSPRMRGTRGYGLGLLHLGGIIPAYAGNTFASCRVTGVTRDHPRVCGEHLDPACGGRMFWGSSPRMRGTRGGTSFPSWLQGIIPAYAGNTRSDGPL